MHIEVLIIISTMCEVLKRVGALRHWVPVECIKPLHLLLATSCIQLEGVILNTSEEKLIFCGDQLHGYPTLSTTALKLGIHCCSKICSSSRESITGNRISSGNGSVSLPDLGVSVFHAHKFWNKSCSCWFTLCSKIPNWALTFLHCIIWLFFITTSCFAIKLNVIWISNVFLCNQCFSSWFLFHNKMHDNNTVHKIY